jgi:hypothetical protein
MAGVHRIRVTEGNRWFDESLELAVNRERGDRLWILYVQKRRYADNYFLTRPLLNGAGEFAVSHTNNVTEFSFATVSEREI